jgi:hypothetical protein
MLPGEATFKQQVLPQHDPRSVVHIQQLDRDDARLGLADERCALPNEMAFPILLPRMEQCEESAVDQPCQVRPLGPVAFRTGQTEVLRIVGAAVLHGDDVLDVKRLELILVLVKQAVFAAAASPLPDKGSERIVHHSPLDAASSWRALDFRIAMNVA